MDAADPGSGVVALALAFQGQSPLEGRLVIPLKRLFPAAADWADGEGR